MSRFETPIRVRREHSALVQCTHPTDLFEDQVGCPPNHGDVRTSVDFVDEVTLEVAAGDGGNGCIAFRREKYVPLGGPSGGDGGRGGDIKLVADRHVGTLLEFRNRRRIKAERGSDASGSKRYAESPSARAPATIAMPIALRRK